MRFKFQKPETWHNSWYASYTFFFLSLSFLPFSFSLSSFLLSVLVFSTSLTHTHTFFQDNLVYKKHLFHKHMASIWPNNKTTIKKKIVSETSWVFSCLRAGAKEWPNARIAEESISSWGSQFKDILLKHLTKVLQWQPITALTPAQLVLNGGWQHAGCFLKLSHDNKPIAVIFHFLPFFYLTNIIQLFEVDRVFMLKTYSTFLCLKRFSWPWQSSSAG